MDAAVNSNSALLSLPAELLHHVLSFLTPLELAAASQTCRTLHQAASDDQLWASILFSNLPHPPRKLKEDKAANKLTYRDVYTGLHPYWFLTKHRLWFSNAPHTGKLILARYSHRRQCIEAYMLTGIREIHRISTWSYNPDVIIHSFFPKINLPLDQPALKLVPRSARNARRESDRLGGVKMDVGHHSFNAARLDSRFMLCTPLPQEAIRPNTQTWPPMHMPAYSRVHGDTQSSFMSRGHMPSSPSQISEHNFRIKQVVSFGNLGGISFATQDNDPATYATIPREAYTPTKKKPWRGIWVGDYSGHGCEFLVLLQPEGKDVKPLPQGITGAAGAGVDMPVTTEEQWIQAHFQAFATHMPGMLPPGATDSDDDSLDGSDNESNDDIEIATASQSPHSSSSTAVPGNGMDESAYSGRLEAIKLTGDVNIPRAEYTFIAPDIGKRGFIRVADEEPFRGARIVKSFGHIAARGFRHDGYTPSQLILISENKIAQYWEAFGHISYYQRVDIERFLDEDEVGV